MIKQVNNKKEIRIKGITLVALVVTIVVLLILAGITITFLLGENGIIAKAQKAQEEQERAKVEEMLMLGYLDNYINEALRKSNGIELTSKFNELTNAGYEVRSVGNTGIKGLIFQNSTGENISELNIEQNKSITVRISLELENDDNAKYYVKIKNSWYEIITEGKINLATEGIKDLGAKPNEIKLSPPASGIKLLVEGEEITKEIPVVNGTSFTLEAGGTVGAYNFNVKVENTSFTKDVEVNVVDNPLYAKSINISSKNGSSNVYQGEIIQLQANLQPNSTTDTVTWSIANGSGATIDGTGRVTVQEDATANTTITVMATVMRNGVATELKDTLNITILENPAYIVTGVTVSPSTLELVLGEEGERLTASVQPSSANQNVTWASEDEDIATVDQNGNVMLGTKLGTVTITATSSKDNNKKGTCTVTVIDATIEIAMNVSNIGDTGWTNNITEANNKNLSKYTITYYMSETEPENASDLSNASVIGTNVSNKTPHHTYYVWAKAVRGTNVTYTTNYIEVNTSHSEHEGNPEKEGGCYINDGCTEGNSSFYYRVCMYIFRYRKFNRTG